MKHGAAYIRVSTNAQEELSPDAQKRLILEYAKKNDIVIANTDIFIENGISGRNASKRPKFQEMIARAKSTAHPFDVLLVWKYSRFARNQEESIFYKSMLKRDRVDVISVSEPLIDGPFGSLIERIIEWMDEYYSIRLSGEVMRGMTENALRGKYQAPAPLGYDTVKGGIPRINEEQAKIVHFIFDSYEAGMDFSSIAKQLNAQGCRSKRGGVFELRSVKYILENPFYIGKIRWNRRSHASSHENAPSEMILVDGRHEPIISTEQFTRVTERMKREYRPIKRHGVVSCKHWLCGVLKCPICGSNMVYFRENASNRPYGYFYCWKYAKGMHPVSTRVSEQKVLSALYPELGRILQCKTLHFNYKIPSSIHTEPMQKQLQNDLKKNEQKFLRIKSAYENGIDTLEEYKENKARLTEERGILLAKTKAKTATKEEDTNASQNKILEHCQNVSDVLYSDADTTIKASAIRSICERIVYHNDTKTIDLCFYIS